MLGLVVGGNCCRPHPAEWRRTLIVRSTAEHDQDQEDAGQPMVLRELQQIMQPYVWVRALQVPRGSIRSDYCLIKSTGYQESQAMLEMLREQVEQLGLTHLQIEWALDRNRDPLKHSLVISDS